MTAATTIAAAGGTLAVLVPFVRVLLARRGRKRLEAVADLAAKLSADAGVPMNPAFFLAVFAVVSPVVDGLGGIGGVADDAIVTVRAITTAHRGIVAAKLATSDGGKTVTFAEGKAIAAMFVVTVADEIAKNAKIGSVVDAEQFAIKLGDVLFPKAFAHITGQTLDVALATAKAIDAALAAKTSPAQAA